MTEPAAAVATNSADERRRAWHRSARRVLRVNMVVFAALFVTNLSVFSSAASLLIGTLLASSVAAGAHAVRLLGRRTPAHGTACSVRSAVALLLVPQASVVVALTLGFLQRL